MSRFLLEESPPEKHDPMVALVVAAIMAMTEAQRNELAQRLAQADREADK
jgi:hypothetical protein